MNKFETVSDSLADRMRKYESAYSQELCAWLPIMARLDGRNFSTFTKHTRRPFSDEFQRLMLDLTRYLVEETGANAAFTASDELTLAWFDPERKSEPPFGGRIQKAASTLSAMASVKFNHLLMEMSREVVEVPVGPERPGGRDVLRTTELARSGLDLQKMPTFDARLWVVPDITEVGNNFLWRQNDATRNSIQMLARHHFSHSECLNKSSGEMQEMLMSRGINWNDTGNHFKRGTFFLRTKTVRRFTTEELEALPPKHAARTNPDLVVERRGYSERDYLLTRYRNVGPMLMLGEPPRSRGGLGSSPDDHVISCNLHENCDKADDEVLAREGEPRTRAYHCRSDDCEDCFPK